MKFKILVSLLSVALIMCMLAGCNAGEGYNDLGFDKGNSQSPSYNLPSTDAGEMSPEGEAVPPSADNGEAGMPDNTPAIIENPFISTQVQNVSTFSADVDTASYTYFRKLVNMGYDLDELRNAGSAFRIEEFINYFEYEANKPAEDELFGITSSIIPCPWSSENLLLRMTLQAENATKSNGNNLVFLIDVSGSMNSTDKLPLLKKTFSYLVENLTENDVISIVTYSGNEKVVLEGCRGNLHSDIMNAINNLSAKGSTNGEAGLTKAYQIAEANFIEGGNNRIIMASDGDLNVGISSSAELKDYVADKRDRGVYLSVLGFGTGNYRDGNMEAIADNGNGIYYYIDGETEAEKVLGTDLLGTLYTVAEDVKLQVTFDKDYVSEYRLIGYENRILNEEDFEDDTKDAGEVGAGHRVTVLYELKMVESDGTDETTDLKTWLKLAVRHKNPREPLSILNEYNIGEESYSHSLSDDMKFISCVARACMILNRSKYIGNITMQDVLAELNTLDFADYPERAEFKDLISKICG